MHGIGENLSASSCSTAPRRCSYGWNTTLKPDEGCVWNAAPGFPLTGIDTRFRSRASANLNPNPQHEDLPSSGHPRPSLAGLSGHGPAADLSVIAFPVETHSGAFENEEVIRVNKEGDCVATCPRDPVIRRLSCRRDFPGDGSCKEGFATYCETDTQTCFGMEESRGIGTN